MTVFQNDADLRENIVRAASCHNKRRKKKKTVFGLQQYIFQIQVLNDLFWIKGWRMSQSSGNTSVDLKYIIYYI